MVSILTKTVVYRDEDGTIRGYMGGEEVEELHRAAQVITAACHNLAKQAGWWSGGGLPNSTKDNPLHFSNKLCLIHSEISEAMEGDRKSKMDDHLPHRPMREVELADAVIRIFDLAGGYDLDLAGALIEKLAYNLERQDHKPEVRSQQGGKAY